MEQLIEYRVYAEAYYANAGDPKGWHKSPMRTLVSTIEHELVAEAVKADD